MRSSTGEVTAVSITPASFNAQQLASRYTLTIVAHSAARRPRRQGALGESQPGLPAGLREHEQGQDALDPAAFFGQDVNALDRMSTDFARTIVSAILEAF